ncbi:MAG: CoA-acylating methylmalonate-semialdehyde dehydrogenase [Gemmatimonadetes bacterium]|nr:CoA-acylating methylmalonate-semialdehyde dehydrogenase [Gemmatimonadota bacterium]
MPHVGTWRTSSAALAIPNFIDGRWTAASASESLPVLDPATGELLGHVPLSTHEDAAAAVQAAARAFPGWSAIPAVERIDVLFRFRALLEEQAGDLAKLLTREHGKTTAESVGEIRRGIESVTHACAIPTLMMGDTLENIATGVDCETVRQPLGVFAAVTPYNFPVMIPLWFWPFAVATGNTIVLKPSERDPLTHQRIVDLVMQAGLPPGVLNVVHGDQTVVQALLEHPDVKGISFVGSSAVARAIYSAAGAVGKRVQALGGAKNHMIVLPDADYDATAKAVVASVYGATGQRCLAGSIVVGVGDAYEPVRQRILDGASSLRVGYGLEEGVDMGPVISRPHRDRVAGYIAKGAEEGATLVLDGRRSKVPKYPAGHWIGATVLENVRPEMAVGREEIFGPVAGLTRAASLEEAIELVHRNPYGNAVSLFTTSGAAAREFRLRAQISMIGVNIGVVAPMAFFPFGGSRGSFFGDLKAQGRDAISFYTDQRVVISRWPTSEK